MSEEQFLPKKGWTRDAARILLCLIGGVIISINLRTFVYTGGLLPGGISGLTLLIRNVAGKFFGVTIPYGPVFFVLNLPLTILAFRKIGKKFTMYSTVTMLVITLLTDFIPVHVITKDPLLISVFGGIINGAAVALCLFAGATSGGLDFLSIYLSEKKGIDAWGLIMGLNAVLLILNGILLSWDSALYSIIFQFTQTMVIQRTYKRYQKNTLFIVTDKPNEVAEAINRVTSHGATEMEATGMHEGERRAVIYSVISSDQLTEVMKQVREADPKAFINSIKTTQVSGRFFMPPKD